MSQEIKNTIAWDVIKGIEIVTGLNYYYDYEIIRKGQMYSESCVIPVLCVCDE